MQITNITFGNNFSECMLGKISVSEYLEDMKKRYPDIIQKYGIYLSENGSGKI